MSVSDNIRDYRKNEGLSQEELAQKIGVSRQAVTKWETGAGMPDISNVVELAKIFGVSVDELLGAGTASSAAGSYLFESVTEFDIDKMKDFDINLGRAHKISMVGHPGEKVRIALGSDRIATLQQDFKIKLDDGGKSLDIDMNATGNVSETTAKESLDITLELPNEYLGHIELSAIAEEVAVSAIERGSVELSVKTPLLSLDGVKAHTEIDCNIDMAIHMETLEASLDVNQLNCTSQITVPKNACFSVQKKGIKTKLAFREDGDACESFACEDAPVQIELAGFNSELVICR